MSAPVHRLKKSEIIWLASHKCSKHSMSFLEHYNCYLKEHPELNRIGFFDIEASHLQANFGMMLCYAILDDKTGKIYHRSITRKEILNPDISDKKVVEQCVTDLMRFDLVVTFYGSRFDFPFVRTRAMIHDIPFPYYATIMHKDIYFTIRNKFRLHSNRQEVACRTLLGKTQKTHLDPLVWMRASVGDEGSIKYIADHNYKDVADLQALYYRVIDFGYPAVRSA